MQRNQSLDIIKGFLVFVMIGYHAAAFFVDEVSLGRSLQLHVWGFVSGSWIFLSGLIISNHYSVSFQGDPRGISMRLISRGLKLLLIILITNLLIGNITISFPGALPKLVPGLVDIIILDNPAATGLSFEILVSIGNLLILSPIFLANERAGLALASIATLAGILFVSSDMHLPGLVWMLTCGTAGIAAGYAIRFGWFAALVAKPKRERIALAIAFVALIVDFALAWYFDLPRKQLANYLFGIVCVLSTVYLAADVFRPRGMVVDALCLMARYSLFCYLWQMVLIVGWFFAVGNRPILGNYVVVLVIIQLALIACTALLDRLRKKYRFVRWSYDAVFQ
jgi:hypothetical protein